MDGGRELAALHTDSFTRRWLLGRRTFIPGRGFKKALGRSYLFYLGVIAALTVPFLVLDLWFRIFDG